MRVLEGILSPEDIQGIRESFETHQAYAKLEEQSSVYFSLAVSRALKRKLSDAFGIDLINLKRIPFRWIKGDTPAHIDRGSSDFENTYLVYLTDCTGTFKIQDQAYPMKAGTGFVFSEGLSHEVVGTNGSTRLLLGPMSESGFPVGGINIYENGATTTVYIREESGIVQYSTDTNTWQNVPFACYVGNSNADPANNILKIIFTTNITLTSWNQNFWCATDGIQFGSESLNTDGSRTTIVIQDAPLYRGLILNGTLSSTAQNHIYIYNINVAAQGTSSLDDGTYLPGSAGWIGGAYFGREGTNNYIVNCSSSGPITAYGGGILGQGAAYGMGQVTLIGCSSSGDIGIAAGGIVGNGAGSSQGSITCEKCWSEGAINGQDSGGIYGSYAGNAQGSALAVQCYSTGVIVNDAGGIFGGAAGDSVGLAIAEKCYSRGVIQGNGGGIFSRYAAEGSGTTTAINCYSSGTLATVGFGIYGVNQRSGATQITCYVANGSWSDSAANAALDGVPGSSGVGNTWVRIVANTPYELNAMGYTPYSRQVINSSAGLIQNYSQTIAAGESSVEAIQADASGNAFVILQTSGGDSDSYNTLSMSSQTGSISTSTETVPGTYTITLRSIGSYNITTFTLIISSPEGPGGTTTACCVSEISERGLTYEWINDYRIGNRLILEHQQNPNLKFNGYSEYVKYKMAQGSRKV